MSTLADLWARMAHLPLWGPNPTTEADIERRQRELRRRLASLEAEERLYRDDHPGRWGEPHARDR